MTQVELLNPNSSTWLETREQWAYWQWLMTWHQTQNMLLVYIFVIDIVLDSSVHNASWDLTIVFNIVIMIWGCVGVCFIWTCLCFYINM